MIKINVDAELFSGENNIVNNIIIQLFNYFESNIGSVNIHNKRDILAQFEILHNDIDFITKYGKDKKFRKQWSQEPLECLSGMASAANLRDHIIELKKLLVSSFGDISIEINNYNFTNQNNRHSYYLDKYISGIFKYNVV
jgi:hypothetical protein